MDPDAKQTVQMAALGRPFNLGMLYDCRKDSLIPSMTLWDHDDLLNHIGERPQCFNDFEIVASESIEDKSSSLNVDASLKLSVLFGLLNTNGSAKYLEDCKKSKNQARVTLKYEATTKFRELSMNHLGGVNIKYPDVFDKGVATHVVTAILYGAQAFFVFDREVSQEENHQVAEGNLKSMIKMIPGMKGDESLQLNDETLAKVEKFSCKFHGDFFLDKNPVSYQDAVQVYQSLPKLLGAKREKVVPLKVWLLPLACLDSGATQLVRQISTLFVRRVQTVIEDFSELEMRSNDAIKTMIAQQFPEVGKKLKTFKKVCFDFKEKFQQDLAKKLPLIRGGEEEEVLPNPFNMDKLMKWMDCAEKEIYILQSFINMMKNIKIVPSENDLHKETLSAEHAVCFVFTPLGSAEPYLSALPTYLNETDKPVPLETKEVLDAMRHKAKLFGDFSEANKENKNIKFLIVALPNKAQKGSSIHLYKDGFPVTEDFEPPSKPETVKERHITHNSVMVNICPPRFGAKNITSYSVEYCVSGEDEWQETRASTALYVTVSSLKPATQYMFKCRAVTSEGVGPAREVHHSIKTLPSEEPETEYDASCKCGIPLKSKETITIHVCTKTCEFPEAAQSVLEDFTELEMRCNNAMTTTIAQQFPQIGKKLKTFKELCSVFKLEFQLTVAEKLPSILKGGEEEVVLADILKKRHSSPFNNTNLMKWMDCKEKEISILKFFTKMMNNTKIVPSQNDLHEEIISAGHAVCFVFTSLGSAEPYLSALSNYLIETPKPDNLQDTHCQDIEKEQWYASPEVSDAMRNKAKLFSDFAEANQEKNIKFLTVGLTNETQKGSSIYVYNDPLSVNENFEPPSKPETVTASDVTHNSVTLKIFPPRFGAENITSYSVEYCVSGEDGWQQILAPKTEKVTVSGLTPNTGYILRCRAVTSVGVGPAVEVSSPIKALPCSPFGKPQIETSEEVLKEQKNLEVIESLQPQVKAGLAKLEEMKTTKEENKDHETVMTSNENMIEVDIIKPVQKQLTEKGELIANCQKCSVTCCASVDGTGMCTVCPGKCIWSVHFNQIYKLEYVKVKEKQTLQELKNKYENATKEKLTIQDLIERQEGEIVHLQDWIVSLMDQSAHCITRLQEIALRPNPLTTPEYIDMLIEGEKSEAEEGYQARIQSLEAMKDRAKIISKVTK
ncbi:uncharacterized protein [Thunnus thynnus]|uniref:uncharacterized protein n=1 Tax=Thunnus thynnus TaxID=8237 RepID=UPI0035281DF2